MVHLNVIQPHYTTTQTPTFSLIIPFLKADTCLLIYYQVATEVHKLHAMTTRLMELKGLYQGFSLAVERREMWNTVSLDNPIRIYLQGVQR